MELPVIDPADAAAPQFTRADKLVIAACAISMLIVQMDWFALNLAIPAIARDFDMASTDLQWVVSGFGRQRSPLAAAARVDH